MRRMGYVAAAAAGMIVPLAMALPASAETSSPVHTGVSNFQVVDDDEDDDPADDDPADDDPADDDPADD